MYLWNVETREKVLDYVAISAQFTCRNITLALLPIEFSLTLFFNFFLLSLDITDRQSVVRESPPPKKKSREEHIGKWYTFIINTALEVS